MSDPTEEEADKQPPLDSAKGIAKLPNFAVKICNAVAVWSYDIDGDVCPICRNHLNDLCIECQASDVLNTAEDCPTAKGLCKHVYHLHCISKWLKVHNVCPLDNQKWEFQLLIR